MSTLDPETNEVKDEFQTDIAPESGSRRRGRIPYPRDEAGNIIRPDGTKGTTTRRSKVSLEAQIDGLVTLVNTFVIAFKPIYALDPIEKQALVKALDQQCQTSPKFRKYMERFLQGAGGVNLLGVVLMIVSRRIMRANLIPFPENAPVQAQDVDNLIGSVLYATIKGTPAVTS